MNARTQHGLTREEREALGWAMLNCPKPSAVKTAPPPGEFTTEQAALVLRSRGYDVDFPALSYLIRQEIVSPSRKEGERNYRWDRSDIEQAAQHLEKERKFTASYEAADTEGTDPFQEELAFHHAMLRTKLTDRVATDHRNGASPPRWLHGPPGRFSFPRNPAWTACHGIDATPAHAPVAFRPATCPHPRKSGPHVNASKPDGPTRTAGTV